MLKLKLNLTQILISLVSPNPTVTVSLRGPFNSPHHYHSLAITKASIQSTSCISETLLPLLPVNCCRYNVPDRIDQGLV